MEEGVNGEDPAALDKDVASDVRTVAKGGALQIIGQVSQRSLGFFFGIVAVLFVGPAGYGLYRKVTQYLSIAGQIGLSGFNYAGMRFIARARGKDDASSAAGALRVSLIGTAIASALVFAALLLLDDYLGTRLAGRRGDPAEMTRLLRLGAFYVPLFAFLQTLRYITQAYRTMVPSVVTGNIVQPVLRFLIGVSALALGFEVTGMVISQWLSVALAVGLAAFYVRRMTAKERRAAPRARAGEIVRFAVLQGGSSLLGVQTLGLGIIILGLYAGDFQVGLFAIALSLQGPGTVFLGGIVNIWAPVVSELHGRGDMARLDALYKTINRWIATFSFPVFAAMIIQPDVFAAFYGPEAADAAPLIPILALGNFFYTGTGPTGYVLSMSGRPGINLINSAFGVALYIGLGIWLVPRHGAIAMAAVDSIVTALVNSARVIEAKLLVGVQPFGKSFFKPVLATLIGAAVLLAWRLLLPDDLLVQGAGLLPAAAAYLLTLRALGIDPEERHVYERIKARVVRRRA